MHEDETDELSWFVVQTKPGRENLACSHLDLKGVEVFLPKTSIPLRKGHDCRQRSDRLKPLFPCYLFARFHPVINLDIVRYLPGILRVLNSGGIPVPVDESVISEIQSRICPDGFIPLQPNHFQRGDVVVIQNGHFQGFMGRVERECDDQKRVSILLNILHQATVQVEKSSLAVI